MNCLKINLSNVEVTPKTAARIEKTAIFALDRFAHTIRNVEIKLLDTNGPKGGVDKRCRIRVHLFPRGIEVVHSSASSIEQATTEACAILSEVLARRLDRARTKHRRAKHLSGAFMKNIHLGADWEVKPLN